MNAHDVVLVLIGASALMLWSGGKLRSRALHYGALGATIGWVTVDLVIDTTTTLVVLGIVSVWATVELVVAYRDGARFAERLVDDVRAMPEPLKMRLVRFEMTKRINETSGSPVARHIAMKSLDKHFPEPKED